MLDLFVCLFAIAGTNSHHLTLCRSTPRLPQSQTELGRPVVDGQLGGTLHLNEHAATASSNVVALCDQYDLIITIMFIPAAR